MSNRGKHSAASGRVDVLTERFVGGNRLVGIGIGIVMALLGILFITRPIATAFVLDLVAVAGFLLYGVYQIAAYLRTPPALRSGWQLALGIVWVLMAVMILASGQAGVVITFALALGFLALLSGIMQISAYGAVRELPGSSFLLASGIVSTLLGIFLLFAPLMTIAVVEIAQGIYLLVAGIALVFETFSGYGHKVK
ncbi:MAG: DUF308 domain-containing protein [Coriobacteriales bacterium]|jgi:uncharacterized membrane protein HdeD (DUF308 family)|nr:DUF308 domain-containing protein [Coriobacteriales bacterium]